MRARLTLFLALLLLCTGAALATTPDGQTPSEETVCDSEAGAAYGLCNAYCEAMDCDSGNAQASPNACSKVRSKFQNITGRDLPCEAASCPCVGNAVFDNVLANADSCFDDGDRIGAFSGNDFAAANAENFLCGYGTLDPPTDTTIPITPAQSQVCVDLIRAACPDPE